MTAPNSPFGPYSFTLAAAEADAAAARLSLRIALGSSARTRIVPLALFTLVVTLAAILALSGLIARRVGELALIIAAAAFMIQRLATRLRLNDARRRAQAAVARLRAEGELTTTFDSSGVTLAGGEHRLRIEFSDCEEAEDAGALLYLWPRRGEPIVLPTRALPEGEAGPLAADLRKRVALRQAKRRARPASLLRGR